MQYYRNNPDETIRHDWLAGAVRVDGNIAGNASNKPLPHEKDSVRCLRNALESEAEGLDWEAEYWLARAAWWERTERMEAAEPMASAIRASSLSTLWRMKTETLYWLAVAAWAIACAAVWSAVIAL